MWGEQGRAGRRKFGTRGWDLNTYLGMMPRLAEILKLRRRTRSSESIWTGMWMKSCMAWSLDLVTDLGGLACNQSAFIMALDIDRIS